MTQKRNLHLLVPGLLGPMPTLDQTGTAVRFDLLERLFARAQRLAHPGRDLESVLLGLFGISADSGRNLPTAAYRRIGDGAPPDDRYWLQLTPVYLRPDQDRLLLFDVEDLELTLDEANELAQLFNSHFADEGWQVEVRHPHRWYLSLGSPPRLKTYELADVFGRNMDLFLPEGEEGIRWHGVLNEIQMLFYSADLNTRREQAGKGPINGLWLSGGGRLSERPRTELTLLYGDSPLLRGLAEVADKPLKRHPGQADPLFDSLLDAQAVESLVCYDRLQRPVLCADPYAWREQVRQFEAWLEPLVDAVRAKRLDSIRLYTCNGHSYHLDRSALRRFWKRPRPMATWLDRNQIP